METMDDFLTILLAEPVEDRDPMRPGMHGKIRAKGGMSAEEVLMEIDKVITCWKTGTNFEQEDDPMGKDGAKDGIQGSSQEREEEDRGEGFGSEGEPEVKGKGKARARR